MFFKKKEPPDGHNHTHNHTHAKPQQHSAPQGGRVSLPGVKQMIAVASGKGGVGKSTVALNTCLALAKRGLRVGLLDADIYGPSIPLMMGIDQRPAQANGKLMPIIKYDLKVMSMGFLVDANQPVVWRGPMVHGALTQFMTQVDWGELDYLLIDMPPGTGDAQLTMSQTAPLSGAIIVTTPQEVSLIDARKGLQMFKGVHVPVLGIIENMAGFRTPNGELFNIFKEGGGKKLAQESETDLLGSIPLDPVIAEGGDDGKPVVLKAPDSVVSKIFGTIAQSIVRKMEVQSTQEESGFRPLRLEWQT